MSEKPFTVIPTKKFTDDVKFYIKKKRYLHIDKDIKAITDELEKGNFIGDEIPGLRVEEGGHTYKVRTANTDAKVGKSNMFITLNKKFDILSILQIINGFAEASPRMKNISYNCYEKINSDFLLWKQIPVSKILQNTMNKESMLDSLYENLALIESGLQNPNEFYSMLKELEQDKIFYTYWITQTNIWNSNIKKIEERFSLFNNKDFQKKVEEKFGIDPSKVFFIYTGLSCYDKVFEVGDQIVYFFGDIASYEEWFYSSETGKANQFFTFKILFKILEKKFTFKNFNRINSEKIRCYLSNFKGLWNFSTEEDFFKFQVKSAALINFLYENNFLEVDKITNFLNLKGAVLSEKFLKQIGINLSYDFLDFINNQPEMEKQIEEKIPNKDFINNIIFHSENYYKNDNNLKPKLLEIIMRSDVIMFGEVHQCQQHYWFLSRILPAAIELGVKNLFFEISKTNEKDINKFVNGEISELKFSTPFYNDSLVIFQVLRDYKIKSKRNFKIFCFDEIPEKLEYMTFDDFSKFIIHRESMLFNNVLQNFDVSNSKSIIITGSAHVLKKNNGWHSEIKNNLATQLLNFLKPLDKTIYSFYMVKSKESSRNEKSTTINSLGMVNFEKNEILKLIDVSCYCNA